LERARSNGNCCSAIMTGFDLAAAIALSVANAPGLPATAVATVKTANGGQGDQALHGWQSLL